jgi:glucosamine--fructose-6-phosphate aminotransferase (isomerizing)
MAADVPYPPAAGAAECILATIRGQQLALHLCQELGIDPDQPPGLNKVTLTH